VQVVVYATDAGVGESRLLGSIFDAANTCKSRNIEKTSALDSRCTDTCTNLFKHKCSGDKASEDRLLMKPTHVLSDVQEPSLNVTRKGISTIKH
jgi:hypothetical protein